MKLFLKYFLVLFISVLFIWQCGTERPDPITAEMKKDLDLLPSSGLGLAYINLEHMRDSDFYKEFIDQHMEDKLDHSIYKQFKEKTGFDIQQDLHQMYIVLLSGEKLSEENGLFLAKGSFDKNKLDLFIEEYEVDDVVRVKTNENWSIYRIEDGKICFAIADENTFIAGKEGLLLKMLNKFKTGDPKDNGVYWEKLIKPVQYKNDMFVSINTSEILDSFEKTEDFLRNNKEMSSVKSIEKLNLSVRLQHDIFLSGSGRFKDSEKARLFLDAFKGALATLKLSVSEDREVIDILNRVKLEQNKESIRLDFNISPADIKKIKEKRSYFEDAKNIVMR
jgi:hypothetical protein